MERARNPGLWSAIWGVLRAPVPPAQKGNLAFGLLFLLLLFAQGATGILLSVYYLPEPEMAAESLAYVMRDVGWGWLIRGLHLWAGYGLIVFGLAQLLRVFTLGTYRHPRASLWCLGVLLLLMFLALAFTGELLPWDHDGYWTATFALDTVETIPFVGHWFAGLLRGGPDVGAATLGRAYSLHAMLLPWLSFYLIVLYLWLLTRLWRQNENEVEEAS